MARRTKYTLVGVDGNAFSIMGYVSRALRETHNSNLIKEYQTKAMSSDYNNLLCVSMEYVEIANNSECMAGALDPEDDEDELY